MNLAGVAWLDEYVGVCRRCGHHRSRPIPGTIYENLPEPDRSPCLCERKPTKECPRCGGILIAEASSRSRATTPRRIAICNPCGSDEAWRAELGLPPVGPSEWPVDSLTVMYLHMKREFVSLGDIRPPDPLEEQLKQQTLDEFLDGRDPYA